MTRSSCMVCFALSQRAFACARCIDPRLSAFDFVVFFDDSSSASMAKSVMRGRERVDMVVCLAALELCRGYVDIPTAPSSRPGDLVQLHE